jgi:tripartite-type tricarboxylate transporter receptor subunit TctC
MEILMLTRRKSLQVAASALAMPFVSRSAWAQTYPTRPLRIIAGFPPGGTVDLLARLIGQWLSEKLGQPVIVENRTGASGNIATEAAVKAAADGYTLLLTTTANLINASLFEKLPFDFARDIAPVACLAQVPNVVVVNLDVPAKTVPEFIAYAKANPGKVNMGSSGSGTSLHVSGELFKLMTRIEMVHVPYRGSGPLLTGLLGGQVQVAFDNIPSSIELIRAGKLRAIAVTSSKRVEVLPDIPAVSEFIPGYEASASFGIGVPRNTPASVIAKLNKEINDALNDNQMKVKIADLGATANPGSSADYGKLIVSEIEKWNKVIKAAGIKAE